MPTIKNAREIAIAVLIVALCLATWQCDRNRGKLNEIDAGQARQGQISTAHAGRKAVRAREATYQGIDKRIVEIEAQRAKLKAEGRNPSPSRKETADEIHRKTEGNINRLAHQFVLAGYTCTVR